MSKKYINKAAKNAIASMAKTPMFVNVEAAANLLLKYNSFAESLSISESLAIQAAEKQKEITSLSFYSANNSVVTGQLKGDFSNVQQGSVAVIPVMGAMMRDDYCSMSEGFVVGTRSLERTISALDANSNVDAIVFHVVTPGGQATGNESLSNAIKASKTPVLVHFEMMASAGVYSFQGAKEVYACEKNSMWGSIGTYMTVYNDDAFWEMMGYEMRDIYATESTLKNIEHREALKGNDVPMLERLDKMNGQFIKHVKAVSNIKDDGKVYKGKLYTADEALKINAIDGIKSLDWVINRARKLAKNQSKNNNTKQSTKMAEESKFSSFFSKYFGSQSTEEVGGKLDEMATKMEDTNLELKKVNTDLQSAKELNKELQGKNESLSQENVELTNQLESAKTEKQDLQTKFDELQQNSKNLQEENEKLLQHNKDLGGALPDATPVDEEQDSGKDSKVTTSSPKDYASIMAEVEQARKKD